MTRDTPQQMPSFSADSVDAKLDESINNSTIVIVEDSHTAFAVMAEALAAHYTIIHHVSAENAHESVFDDKPDLILIDYYLPGQNGLSLCRELRRYSELNTVPMLIVTGETDTQLEAKFWRAGCSDFIIKPFSIATLQHRVQHQLKYKKMLDEYREAAMVDHLTKVFNRRYLQSMMAQLVNRSETPEISMLMLDIDWFKKYNDTYGHVAGDSVLKEVAGALTHSLSRATDFVTRYGGEEFAIILPHTNFEGLEQMAKRISLAITELDIPHKASPFERITVSLGGVTYQKPPKSWQDMVATADKNLYQAKEQGRSQWWCTERRD